MADEIKIPIANENTLQEVKNKLIEMDAKLGNDTLVFTVIDVNRQMSWKDETVAVGVRSDSSAVVVNDNEIYILSGGGLTSYNVETKIFETKASASAVYSVALSYLNGKVYSMGTSAHSVINQEYDIASNTWSVKADMPISTKNAASVVYENSVFLLCSDNASPNNTKTIICKYTPLNNTWTIEAELPQILSINSTMGLYAGKIFIFHHLGLIAYSYDINSKTFESIKPFGSQTRGAPAACIENNLYISNANGTYFYDMIKNEWVTKGKNPYNLETIALACKTAGEDKLFFMGRTANAQIISYDRRPVILAPCKKHDVFYTIGDGVMAGSQELLANEMTVILEDGFIETDREFTFGWLKIGGL